MYNKLTECFWEEEMMLFVGCISMHSGEPGGGGGGGMMVAGWRDDGCCKLMVYVLRKSIKINKKERRHKHFPKKYLN